MGRITDVVDSIKCSVINVDKTVDDELVECDFVDFSQRFDLYLTASHWWMKGAEGWVQDVVLY